jgi:uncharacterized protein (UPF0548 family)
MFMINEPTDEDVKNFISSQRDLPFTYSEVGATNTALPEEGFTLDRNHIQLGHGEATFKAAVEVLKNWGQFDLGWVTVVPRGVEIKVGATVAVKARAYGTWSLNASRVVYVIDHPRAFGFAYGTLPDHVECGEERFLVAWMGSDAVWYDILAFSRPRHPLVRLSAPLARLLQKRFARESLSRAQRLVSRDSQD